MSGDSDPYSDSDIDDLYDSLMAAFSDYDQRKGHNRATPGHVDVKAQIEWANEFQGPGGVRSTTLGNGVSLDMAPVREAMKLKSYRAKGWQAQLRALNRVRRGPAAMAAAAFRPSRETLRRWSKGEQKPSKANRERIQQAYENLRAPSTRAQKAKAVQAFTDALYGAYRSDVRLRDIERFKFDD